MNVEKKLEEVAKIIAAEEVAVNPSEVNNSELERQIIEQYKQAQAAKDAATGWLIGKLDSVKEVIHGGGIKSIVAKMFFYFIIPVLFLIGIGYLVYRAFTSRKVFLEMIKSVNESAAYADQSTRWKIRVTELAPDIQEDADRQRFESIRAKLNEVRKAKPGEQQ